ncbi:MAG: hypothetical protein U0R19_36235 [Bryobacteraceae bacterium]
MVELRVLGGLSEAETAVALGAGEAGIPARLGNAGSEAGDYLEEPTVEELLADGLRILKGMPVEAMRGRRTHGCGI